MGNAGRVLMIPKGEYNSATTYEMLDFVYYQGRSYVCKQTSTGNVPTNTTYWQALTGDASAEIQALTNEVRGNWGNSGVNLFNKNDVLDATYIDTSTGNLSTTGGTGWITTKPIPLNDNTKVTYSGNSVDAVGAVRYRILQNDTVVSFNGLRANTDTITITQGNYIQFSLRADTQNTFQIEYGSTATPYQPYAKTNVELTQDASWLTSAKTYYDANTDPTVKQNHYNVAKYFYDFIKVGESHTIIVRYEGGYYDTMILSKDNGTGLYCVDFCQASGLGKILYFRYNGSNDTFADIFSIT